MSKPTPGPWEVVARLKNGGHEIGSVSEEVTVCEVDEEPDARLIAAAPELLEALEKAVTLCRCRGTGTYTPSCSMCHDSTWDHECPDDRKCEDECCIAARAAIAKARGE